MQLDSVEGETSSGGGRNVVVWFGWWGWLTACFRVIVANKKYDVEEKKLRPFEGSSCFPPPPPLTTSLGLGLFLLPIGLACSFSGAVCSLRVGLMGLRDFPAYTHLSICMIC